MGAPELPQDDQNNLDEAISISMPAVEHEGGISDHEDSDDELVGNEYAGYQPLAADETNLYESNDDDNISQMRPAVSNNRFF